MTTMTLKKNVSHKNVCALMYVPTQLQSFNVRPKMFQMCHQSVVASNTFYAAECWRRESKSWVSSKLLLSDFITPDKHK